MWMVCCVGAMVAAGIPAGGSAAQPEANGRSLFLASEFKKAARVFESGVREQPGSARLHYWLGKSYARLAEVSSPLFAPRHARKARGHLEQAVRLDGQNQEYFEELFHFYVDSPEWFQGGLKRAATLVDSAGAGREELLQQLAESRKEHSGPAWWIRRAVLWISATVGQIVP